MTQRSENSINQYSQELILKGWEQGCLFKPPKGVKYAWNELGDDGCVVLKNNNVKAKYHLLVGSQTCDIRSSTEPHVEVLVCRPDTNDHSLDRIDRNSTRRFVVDRHRKLVADIRHRTFLDKKCLLDIDPEPWPGSDESFGRFQRWLARRYMRPAFPDDFDTFVRRSVQQRFHELEDSEPQIMHTYSDLISEVRVQYSGKQLNDYEVTFVFLTERTEITPQEAEVLSRVTTEVEQAVETAGIRTVLCYSSTPDQLSVADYFATAPIFLEDITYKGDSVIGSNPPHTV